MSDRLKSLKRRLIESVRAGETTASIIERALLAGYKFGLSENDYRGLLTRVQENDAKNKHLHSSDYEEMEITNVG